MAGHNSHRKTSRPKAQNNNDNPFLISQDDGLQGPQRKTKPKAPRFRKGASTSTTPTKSKRSQHNTCTSGGTLGDDQETEDDEEAEITKGAVQVGSRLGCKDVKFGTSDNRIVNGGQARLKLSGRSASRYGSLGPGSTIPRADDESSLSSISLHSSDEETIRADDDDNEQDADSESDGELDFDGSDTVCSEDDKHHFAKYGDFALNGASTLEEGSELGDVYLEYTDFEGAAFPITWSEADDDTVAGEVTEIESQPQEFADMLLMDVNNEESPFYLANLECIAQESMASSDSDYSGDTDYLIIEDFGGTDVASLSDSKSTDDDGGATTDSLDEDDHSGLVRFGIEVDDDDNDEAAFFDIPQDVDIAAVLSGLNEANGQYFLVEGGESAQQGNLDLGLQLTQPQPTQVVVPVMGSFETSLSEGGRSIINVKSKGVPSPFSGGKVIRYNRFKKLKQQARSRRDSAASMSASFKSVSTTAVPIAGLTADPSPSLTGGIEVTTGSEEEVFDITAFIRGISSKDVSDHEIDESEMDTDRQLDALTRWNKVPMSAFRSSTMASPHWTEGLDHQHLNEAIHRHRGPASLSKTLSPLDPLIRKKKSANMMVSSPLRSATKIAPTRNPRSRKEQRALKKKARVVAMSLDVASSPAQPLASTAFNGPSSLGPLEFGADAPIYGAFESPLFKTVAGVVDDVPMLGL